MTDMIAVLVAAVLSGIAGAIIAGHRNAAGTGFMLGLLLGPLGVAVAFRIDHRNRCPRCMERFNVGACLCPQCGGPVMNWNGE